MTECLLYKKTIMKELKCQPTLPGQQCQHMNHKHKCYGENIYSKVGNEKRLALLDLVKLQGKSLKDAASMLNINYSTAKTILRVYRIENRILKKSPNQKRSLKKRCCGVSGSSHTKENSSVIEEKNDIEVESAPLLNLNVESETTHINLVNSPRMGVKNFQFANFPKEMILQFQNILKSLQICMREVVNNDKMIQNICGVINNFGGNFEENFPKKSSDNFTQFSHANYPKPTFQNLPPRPVPCYPQQNSQNSFTN